uniref:Uncharacterized protein n=1 Tax=Pristionchus pacificus TaxID=54126 RepID=A0A2A6CHJ1_PRIPA|eukprot:PDM77533.1 hypothetical protein PRIPAC_34400 [Pristionchus pacificus]
MDEGRSEVRPSGEPPTSIIRESSERPPEHTEDAVPVWTDDRPGRFASAPSPVRQPLLVSTCRGPNDDLSGGANEDVVLSWAGECWEVEGRLKGDDVGTPVFQPVATSTRAPYEASLFAYKSGFHPISQDSDAQHGKMIGEARKRLEETASYSIF